MKNQLKSFRAAAKGVWRTVKTESHMRFHIVAGVYVLVFSQFYSFTPAQIALLIVLIAAVLALETVNTCIEHICNLAADRFELLVAAAKDAAAGAVLIASAAAAAVAVIFFLKIDVIKQIALFFADNIFMLVLLIISAIASVIFIILGPVGIKVRLKNLTHKSKK